MKGHQAGKKKVDMIKAMLVSCQGNEVNFVMCVTVSHTTYCFGSGAVHSSLSTRQSPHRTRRCFFCNIFRCEYVKIDVVFVVRSAAMGKHTHTIEKGVIAAVARAVVITPPSKC